MLFRPLQELAIHADVVLLRSARVPSSVTPCHLLQSPVEDQLFRLAPRRDSGVGGIFCNERLLALQALQRNFFLSSRR